jgi:hypothetical protein
VSGGRPCSAVVVAARALCQDYAGTGSDNLMNGVGRLDAKEQSTLDCGQGTIVV